MKKLKPESTTLLIPCLYIQAKNDKLVSENHVNEFKKIAPQVKVVVIEGPHFVSTHVNPKRCSLEVILEFAEKTQVQTLKSNPNDASASRLSCVYKAQHYFESSYWAFRSAPTLYQM
ncbi:MAG: hypothetical protein R3F25_12070 [Gammaproteobacteria bacterium]